MTTMDGDELQRLWSLIEDLTHQLQANRQLCESLQQQADQLKGQALHSGTGYALRRFNTDISKEKFESELEHLNAYLVKDNQALAHENKQQAILLREYENTLEQVMAKFRSFSHSTQQHTLQLTAHYENLLANTTQAAAQHTLAAETAFSGTLQHLGGLVRRALRTIDGEGSQHGDGDGEGDDEEGHTNAVYRQNGWPADPRWYGSGGYTGRDLDPEVERSERALEMLTDEERLRLENETLREVLQLKERSDALLAHAPPTEAAPASSVAQEAAGSVSTTDAAASTLAGTAASVPAPLTPTKVGTGAGAAPRSPVSPSASRNPLAVDQASIEAEGSGHPPLRSLEVSETLRPADRSTVTRQDEILEEAIQEEDEEAAVEASLGAQLGGGGAAMTGLDGGERDAVAPSPGVGAVGATPGTAALEPNLVAEAAPSALVSTGLEEGAGASGAEGNTSVSSASGGDVLAPVTGGEDGAPSPAEPSTVAEGKTERISTTTSETTASDPTSLPPPLQTVEGEMTESSTGDFQPDAGIEGEAPLPAEPTAMTAATATPTVESHTGAAGVEDDTEGEAVPSSVEPEDTTSPTTSSDDNEGTQEEGGGSDVASSSST